MNKLLMAFVAMTVYSLTVAVTDQDITEQVSQNIEINISDESENTVFENFMAHTTCL